LLSNQWTDDPWRRFQLLELAVKCRDDRLSGPGDCTRRRSLPVLNGKYTQDRFNTGQLAAYDGRCLWHARTETAPLHEKNRRQRDYICRRSLDQKCIKSAAIYSCCWHISAQLAELIVYLVRRCPFISVRVCVLTRISQIIITGNPARRDLQKNSDQKPKTMSV